MAAPITLALEQHLCYGLYSTSLKMTQLYKPLLAPLNLTYPQYLVMVVLWEQDGIGIKDLAARLQQDSGSITPLVKRLEVEGYVHRGRDPNDERHRVLTLTAAGKKLRVAGIKVNECIAAACGITHKELDILMGALQSLNTKLSA